MKIEDIWNKATSGKRLRKHVIGATPLFRTSKRAKNHARNDKFQTRPGRNAWSQGFTYPEVSSPRSVVGFGLFDDWQNISHYRSAFRDVVANCGGEISFRERIDGLNVFIKPVLLSAARKTAKNVDAGNAAEQLSPITLRAVCDVVNEYNPNRLVIWSNGATICPFDQAIVESGFKQATEGIPNVEWYDGSKDAVKKLIPPDPICSTIYYWPERVAKEADTVISLSNAKTHIFARVTENIKNLTVSGAPPQAMGSCPTREAYYKAVDNRDPHKPFPANIRKYLHFKSYIDWYNRYGGKEPYDLPLQMLSFHAELADDMAAIVNGTNVRYWMGLNEFTIGVVGSGPCLNPGPTTRSWIRDYSQRAPAHRYFLVGGYDLVAVDTIGAACMGYSPFEIQNPHTELRFLQFAAMHKLGTYKLNEILVKGVTGLHEVNTRSERAYYSDAYEVFRGICPVSRDSMYVPADERVTEFLDMRSDYYSERMEEVRLWGSRQCPR